MTDSQIAQLVTAAQRLVMPLRTLAILSLLASVWLWSLPVSPATVDRWWTIAGAGILLIALATPAAVVFLFYLGVQQIVHMPGRLTGMTRGGVDRGRELLATMKARNGTSSVGRRGTIIRAIIDMARAALDAKGLIMDTVSLVRLLNPITLAIVSIAVVASIVLIGVAAISALVVVIL